ncbi:MAG: hypothetical protein V3V08_11310, partial [Nannocystaceae bacterium]
FLLLTPSASYTKNLTPSGIRILDSEDSRTTGGISAGSERNEDGEDLPHALAHIAKFNTPIWVRWIVEEKPKQVSSRMFPAQVSTDFFAAVELIDRCKDIRRCQGHRCGFVTTGRHEPTTIAPVGHKSGRALTHSLEPLDLAREAAQSTGEVLKD